MESTFTRAEYEGRIQRATKLMEDAGLDALLLTAEANINYFSGYLAWSSWTTFTRPTVLLIPKAGAPVLLVQDVWLGAARRDSIVDDIRGYSRLGGAPVDSVVDAIENRGLKGAKIGMEFGYEQRLGISYADLQKLLTRLPECKLIDASDLLWRLRVIKSTTEVECIRQACNAAFQVFENGFARLTEGDTEPMVIDSFRMAAAEVGKDIGFIIPVVGPQYYRAMTSRLTNRALAKGDMIWVDLSIIFNDYRSDFSRAAVVGGPSETQLRLWEDAHKITMRGIAKMGPGVPIRDIVEACKDEAGRRGISMGSFATGRLGHGIGLMTTEPPHISLYDETILEPGMVLAIEPGVITDEGVFVPEQDVVITKEGHEILSDGFWELKTIGVRSQSGAS